jgi:hypothetical protein
MPCEVVLLRVDIFKMAAVAMETAKMERDKQKISESVGQTLPQLPWKQKKGGFKTILDSFHQNS